MGLSDWWWGQQFEDLNVQIVVSSMVDWVDKEINNTIHIIKDNELLESAKDIEEE